MATLTALPLATLVPHQAQALPSLQASCRSALCSVTRIAQLPGSQRFRSRLLALSRDDEFPDCVTRSEDCCSGSGRSGEEVRSSGVVMRVSGASALGVGAVLATAGASLADEVAASGAVADGSDVGISTTVSVLFVVATVGLVVLTGGVIYLALTEYLEKRQLQEEQKKVEAAKPKKEKSAKQTVKAAARAGGPKGFGSGKRKDDDEEVSS